MIIQDRKIQILHHSIPASSLRIETYRLVEHPYNGKMVWSGYQGLMVSDWLVLSYVRRFFYKDDCLILQINQNSF